MRFNLKTAVQTAKYGKYAKGKGVEWTRTFNQWENLSSSNPFAFAWHFAVPSAFSRCNVPRQSNSKISLFHRFLRIIDSNDDATNEQLPEMLFGIRKRRTGLFI